MDSLPEVPGIALRSDGRNGRVHWRGYAVEERGFSYGCVKTRVKDRSWTHWYFLPFIDYGAASDMETSCRRNMRWVPDCSKGHRRQRREAAAGIPAAAGLQPCRSTERGRRLWLGDQQLCAPSRGGGSRGGQEKYGEKSHAALMDALSADDEAPEPPAAGGWRRGRTTPKSPVRSHVVIVSEGGKVNIRVGNGTQYGRITQLAPGTTLDYGHRAERLGTPLWSTRGRLGVWRI